MILLAIQGISMAPGLKPGDVLMVDPGISKETLRVGDVAVFRNATNGNAIAHRVVSLPLMTKGDRNRDTDPLTEEWVYEGKGIRRNRNGTWKPLRHGRALAAFSKWGLFPGQKLPLWLSRSFLKNLVRS
jgi:signal peptidase I